MFQNFQNPYGMNNTTYNPYQSRLDAMQQMTAPQRMELIRVTGLDGAKAFQMPPNSVAALFDGGEDIFYVKSTDGAGFPTIRAFRFTPIEAAQNATNNQDFVTRAEFEQLKGMILNAQQPVYPESANVNAVKPNEYDAKIQPVSAGNAG